MLHLKLLLLTLTLAPLSLADVTLQTPHETRIGEAILSRTNGDLSNLLKPPHMLDRYFTCYLTSGQTTEVANSHLERYGKFKENYAGHINSAATHFKMPQAFSSCIMFRETFFDEDVTSGSGAKSIAQFTPSTYDTLKNNMSWGREFTKYNNELYGLIDSGVNVLALESSENPLVGYHQFAQRDGPAYNRSSSEERTKSEKFSREKIYEGAINSDLTNELDNYLREAYQKLSASQKKKYFPDLRPGDPPASWKFSPPEKFEDFIKNPVWVTGLNMYYLKQMMIKTNASVDISKFKGDDMIGFLTLIAGAYNGGPGKLENAIESGKSNVKDWCKILSEGSEETKNYMLSVRRCLTNGNFSAPTKTEPSKDCKPLMIIQNPDENTSAEETKNLNDPCFVPEIPKPKARPPNLLSPEPVNPIEQ